MADNPYFDKLFLIDEEYEKKLTNVFNDDIINIENKK